MTKEKMILNIGQCNLDMRTRKISVSADVLADKGWHKLADDERVVKKVELTKEEAEWFEKHKDLPFYNSNINLNFSYMLVEQAEKYSDTVEQDFINRMSQAYFTGYTIKKEKKYYIKLGFNGDDNNLNVDHENGTWYWGNEMPVPFVQFQYTQAEIDEMQKDPRAKGLDLNVLKVEVPEDELEE